MPLFTFGQLVMFLRYTSHSVIPNFSEFSVLHEGVIKHFFLLAKTWSKFPHLGKIEPGETKDKIKFHSLNYKNTLLTSTIISPDMQPPLLL